MIADNIRVKNQHAKDLDLEIKSQIQGGKLIVKAYSLNDKIEYQGELQPNPYIDFQDIQELIDANKSIKIVTKTPNLLKIKVGAAPIQLVGKQKIDLQNLSETFEKFMKNQSLMEKQIKEQKEELNQHKNLIFGMKKQIEEMKLSQQEKDLIFGMKKQIEEMKLSQQEKDSKSLRFQQTFIEENSKLQNGILQNLNEINKIRQEIRSQTQSMKLKAGSYKNLIDEFKSEINQLKFECYKTSTTVVQQSKEFKQHEIQLKYLISCLQSKLNCQLKFEASLSISGLNEPIRSCKWSEQSKSKQLTINKNVVTKTTKYNIYGQFCLLNVSFSNELTHKQSWAIRINKITRGIKLGVCLKNKMNGNFNDKNVKWDETGHGLYMIGSGGRCYSHSQKEFNEVNKNFYFGSGDVIYIEYDPIDKKLRFFKNKVDDYFEMSIIAPPQNDAYHPCVSLCGQNESVQLLSPSN